VNATFPDLVVLPDDEENAKAQNIYIERSYKDFCDLRQFLDDHISGWWSGAWKPADKLALYEAQEPLFIAPDFVLEIVAANFGPMVAQFLRPGTTFANMMDYRPDECARMLKDYANLKRARDKREMDKAMATIEEVLGGAALPV
jgi:hypothetical protein